MSLSIHLKIVNPPAIRHLQILPPPPRQKQGERQRSPLIFGITTQKLSSMTEFRRFLSKSSIAEAMQMQSVKKGTLANGTPDTLHNSSVYKKLLTISWISVQRLFVKATHLLRTKKITSPTTTTAPIIPAISGQLIDGFSSKLAVMA